MDLFDPDPATISIEDIAWHLGNQCRWTGATRRFYSVAEHCVVGSRFVSDANRLAFLLHDATEAYLGDMARPLKRMPAMQPYREAEARLWRVIAAKFGVPEDLPEEVHVIDGRMLATEHRDLRLPRDEADRFLAEGRDYVFAGAKALPALLWDKRRGGELPRRVKPEQEFLVLFAKLTGV